MPVEKTRRKEKLGRALKQLRETSPENLKPADVATSLKCSATTVTRLEGGYTHPRWSFIDSLLRRYGATEAQMREIETLWENAAQVNTTVEDIARLPPKYRAFRRDESDAKKERSTNVGALSGLAQTARYAVAQGAVQARTRDEGWEERVANERRSRQRLLEGERPLEFHTIMSEHLIWQLVGGREVMIEQLEHLLELAKKPHVTMQLVPIDSGAWTSSPRVLLTFEGDDPDLAYLEHAAGGETVENSQDVQAFIDTFEHVSRHIALSPEKSVKLIEVALNARRNDEQQPISTRYLV